MEKTVTEISKRYKVSDVTIHKICKSFNIPTPPIGYWAKVRAGKPVKQIPLPQSKEKAKTGQRTGFEYRPPAQKDTLAFMSEADKQVVISLAAQIRIPDENDRMHSKIIAHRKAISAWKKEQRVRPADRWGRKEPTSAPFLADTISEEALPRVFATSLMPLSKHWSRLEAP